MSIPTMFPSVGVVIRTKNSEAYLSEAMQSVISQQYAPLEIVVVDGGSTDRTIEIIQSLSPTTRIIQQTLSGLGGSAQNGIDALRTDLVAFQDSDDIWTPGRLKAMVSALLERPHCAAVLGSVEHFLSPELDQEQHKNLLIHEGLQPGFGLPALLAHRWMFHEVGPFTEGFPYGEYIDFIDRFRAKGLVMEQLDIPSLQRRVHKTNFTQENQQQSNMLKALQMLLARRRNESSDR